MTTPMTCEMFEDRLAAYLEQETDDATKLAIERHAVACGECGPLLADLRKLRFDAANLPALEPTRDLWAGIASRIQAPVVSINGARAEPFVRGRRNWPRVALIAASLVLAAGLGYYGAVRRLSTTTTVAAAPTAPTPIVASAMDTTTRVATEPATTVASATPAATPSARQRIVTGAPATTVRNGRQTGPEAILASERQLTRDYNGEITRLRAIIEQRRNQLDPVTVAIIEKNLAVIDTAIVQCRMAIARDPSSHFLLQSLNQSLQTKVELMRTAALLPSRT